jgi:soluble lytic murein transglycosylase-like protein
MHANEAQTWLPALNAAEKSYGIPTNLLARIAYQESSFLPDVISGERKSSASAVGIMQLMPQFFPQAGASPDNDIETAANLLKSLYEQFDDWQVAVAAYNWGKGAVHHEYVKDGDRYVLADFPQETQNYVRQIFADVPLPGALLA